MNISRISLCQNEEWNYDYLPRALDSDYRPIYDFKYPFSFELALDCERIVYKLKEYDISSEMCWHLVVTFINTDNKSSELMDYISFDQTKMRFVNISEKAELFNSKSIDDKRVCILKSIYKAIVLVTKETDHTKINQIITEVAKYQDDIECVLIKKCTRKYNASVRFKSSIRGYDAILYLECISKNEIKRINILEKVTYAELTYKIN